MSMTHRLKEKFPDSNEADRDVRPPPLRRISCGVQMSPHLIVRFKPRKRSLTEAIRSYRCRWRPDYQHL